MMNFKPIGGLRQVANQARKAVLQAGKEALQSSANAVTQAAGKAVEFTHDLAEKSHPFSSIENKVARETEQGTSLVAKIERKENELLCCTFHTGERLVFEALPEFGQYTVGLQLDAAQSADGKDHVSTTNCSFTDIHSVFDQVSTGVFVRSDLEASIPHFSSNVVLGVNPKVKMESKAQQDKPLFHKDINGEALEPEVKPMRDLPLVYFQREANILTPASTKLYMTIKEIFKKESDNLQNLSLAPKETVRTFPSFEKPAVSAVPVTPTPHVSTPSSSPATKKSFTIISGPRGARIALNQSSGHSLS
jgi:hypothetical protein